MPASRRRKVKKRTAPARATAPTWNAARAARETARTRSDIVNWLLPEPDAPKASVDLMRAEVAAALTSHAHLGAEALAVNLHCNLGLDVTPEQVSDPEATMPAIVDQWLQDRGTGIEIAEAFTLSPEAAQVVLAASAALTPQDVQDVADTHGGRFGNGYIVLPETINYAQQEDTPGVVDRPHVLDMSRPDVNTLAAVACIDGAVSVRTAEGVVQEGYTPVPRIIAFAPVEEDTPSPSVRSHIHRFTTAGATVPYMMLDQEGWVTTSAAVIPDPDTDTTAEDPQEARPPLTGTYRKGTMYICRSGHIAERFIVAFYLLAGQGIIEGTPTRTSPANSRDRARDDWPVVTVFTAPNAKDPREDRMPAHSAWGPDWEVSITATRSDEGVVFSQPVRARITP